MRTVVNLGLFVCLLTLSEMSQASTDSKAADLRKFCVPFTTDTKPSIEKAYCRGYVVGWREGIEGTLTTEDKGMVQTVTFEDGVTDEQMAKVFVQYMASHPKEENKARTLP